MSGRRKPAARGAGGGIEEIASRLRFSFDTGHIWLGEERMMLLHMTAFAGLRKEIVDTLGIERARGLLTRMGFAAGTRDAELVRRLYPESSDVELARKGPLLHTLEGVVKVEPVRLEMDLRKRTYYGDLRWENSFEEQAHRRLFGVSAGPVCWMQTGYATGYVSHFLGRFVLFIEHACGAGGCRIVGQPLPEWDKAVAAQAMKYYEQDSVAEELLQLQDQLQTLRDSLAENVALEDLVGDAPAFRRATALIRKAAKSRITVLLSGETGVGKERFARALHKASDRAGGPFVAVNCGALPEPLVESELFGVEKGAFTGAHQSRPGRFERAHWGTLFLDEVGELPLAAQTRLLRALQEGEIERVGDTQVRKVDVRVIAATNVDLDEAVRAGRFRKDLYYRLNAYPVAIPPLRERREDVAPLALRFVEQFAGRDSKRVLGLTDKALYALQQYPWPGNVRELANVIERGVLLAPEGGRIDADDLFLPGAGAAEALAGVDRQGRVGRAGGTGGSAGLARQALEAGLSLEDLQQAMIRAALERSDGKVATAARLLGVTRAFLRHKLDAKD